VVGDKHSRRIIGAPHLGPSGADEVGYDADLQATNLLVENGSDFVWLRRQCQTVAMAHLAEADFAESSTLGDRRRAGDRQARLFTQLHDIGR